MPRPGISPQLSVERFFQLSVLCLVTSGYLAVAGSGYLDLPTIVLTGVGLVLRALLVTDAVKLKISDRLVTVLTLAYIGFYPLDYFFLSRGFLQATVHLVFYLAVVKILTARSNRDYLYTAAIAFLEILAAATLEASLLQPKQSAPRPEYLKAMDELSALAFKAYRGLVYETDGFVDYFWASTVINEIATLNIGSRPASRKKTRAIEDLRAIPWVFSWAQCRLMLPGWYGFASAVESWIAKNPDKGMAFLQELYREWPFFRMLLSNMDMVLAKSSIAIASRYAELVPDVELRDKIFSRIKTEWHACIELLLKIMGQDRLLQGNPLLERSVRQRFPYLDPLNHVQVELLKEHRAQNPDEQVLRGIQITINGISAGLRNTG